MEMSRKKRVRSRFKAAILRVAAERSSSRALEAQRKEKKRMADQPKEKEATGASTGDASHEAPLSQWLVPQLRRASFILAFLLYALVTNTALTTIDCVPVTEERLEFSRNANTESLSSTSSGSNATDGGANDTTVEAVFGEAPELQQVVR